MDDSKQVSRRAMLGGIAIGAGAIGAAAFASLERRLVSIDQVTEGSWWPRRPMALARAEMGDWTDKVGTIFQLAGADGNAAFKLTEVRAMASEGVRPEDVTRSHAFLAVFEGDRQLSGDAIYKATHPTGAFDIYFGPAPSDEPAPKLLALFN